MSTIIISTRNTGYLKICGALLLCLFLIMASRLVVYSSDVFDFNGSSVYTVSTDNENYTFTGSFEGTEDALNIYSSSTITLDNVDISVGVYNSSGIIIQPTVDDPDRQLDVTLIIVGDNYISSENAHAIDVGNSVYLTITGEGTLRVSGGRGSIRANNLAIGPNVTLIGYEGAGSQPTEVPAKEAPPEELGAPKEMEAPAEQSMADQIGTAFPTAASVLVDGSEVAFSAYNIHGSNYFMLRDLAFALDNTAKQFEVSWDEANNAILLISGESYTASGSELQPNDGTNKSAAITNAKVMFDGSAISFSAYNIDGSNYFMLRDLAGVFNFNVGWDGSAITIDTSQSYQP